MQQPEAQPEVETRTFTDEMIDIIRPPKRGNRAMKRAARRAAQDWVLRERCFAALGHRRYSDRSTAFLLTQVNRLAADRHKRRVARHRLIRRALLAVDMELARADLPEG